MSNSGEVTIPQLKKKIPDLRMQIKIKPLDFYMQPVSMSAIKCQIKRDILS